MSRDHYGCQEVWFDERRSLADEGGLFERDEDGAHAGDILGLLARLGVEVAETCHTLPFCARAVLIQLRHHGFLGRPVDNREQSASHNNRKRARTRCTEVRNRWPPSRHTKSLDWIWLTDQMMLLQMRVIHFDLQRLKWFVRVLSGGKRQTYQSSIASEWKTMGSLGEHIQNRW